MPFAIEAKSESNSMCMHQKANTSLLDLLKIFFEEDCDDETENIDDDHVDHDADADADDDLLSPLSLFTDNYLLPNPVFKANDKLRSTVEACGTNPAKLDPTNIDPLAPLPYCCTSNSHGIQAVRYPHTTSDVFQSTLYNKKRSRAEPVPILDDELIVDLDSVFDDDSLTLEKKPNQQNPTQRLVIANWDLRYQELVEFRTRTGHCRVPIHFQENPTLAGWVKRQRYQYKLLVQKRQSALSQERVERLQRIGFVWDSQAASWYDRLKDLNEFKNSHGHCNVPTNYRGNKPLSTWVTTQRHQYKRMNAGKTTAMPLFRVYELELLGFEWELRSSKRQRTF